MHCTDASRCGASGFPYKRERRLRPASARHAFERRLKASAPMTPAPPDEQRRALTQSRWANLVESGASGGFVDLLFSSLPSFCSLLLSIPAVPALHACKAEQGKCNKHSSRPKSKGTATFSSARRSNRKSHEGTLTCDFRSVC